MNCCCKSCEISRLGVKTSLMCERNVIRGKFSYQPFVPAEYILIKFTVNSDETKA